jgi:hypothetical protein
MSNAARRQQATSPARLPLYPCGGEMTRLRRPIAPCSKPPHPNSLLLRIAQQGSRAFVGWSASANEPAHRRRLPLLTDQDALRRSFYGHPRMILLRRGRQTGPVRFMPRRDEVLGTARA